MYRIISSRHGLVACLISLAITVVALVEPIAASAADGGWTGM
jgi:hypothetical protein